MLLVVDVAWFGVGFPAFVVCCLFLWYVEVVAGLIYGLHVLLVIVVVYVVGLLD